MAETNPGVCPNRRKACGYYGLLVDLKSQLEFRGDIDPVDQARLEIVNGKIARVSAAACSTYCHVLGETMLDTVGFEAETAVLVQEVHDVVESMDPLAAIKRIFKKR